MMMDFYEFELYIRGLKRYRVDIGRKEWCRNWREVVYWDQLLDCQIFDVEDAITEYCLKNDIPFFIDGENIHVVSNRYVYNKIQDIIGKYLSECYEEDEEAY